jgi:membrane dipeptidase
MAMPLIVDAHEDLAYNMITQERDYTRPLTETRRLDALKPAAQREGESLISWEEYQRGKVAVVFSTLFAAPKRRSMGGQEDILTYADYNQAYTSYRRQLDLYHRLVDDQPDQFRLVYNQPDLEAVLKDWETSPTVVEKDPSDPRPQPVKGHPVGLVVLMEGADGVRGPSELDEWWDGGVRMIGLAWAGTRYSGGTREPGPLTDEGLTLIDAMADHGFALDLSHMDVAAALQALERYEGPIAASHANPLGMLKGSTSNRHLPDSVVDGIIERDGVIGIVPFNVFLSPTWEESDGKQAITLQTVVAHIDYICQRAGDARHVGLGSDFDGGFGKESVPAEVDSIADLQLIAPLLAEKGYTEADIAGILGGNWLAFLRRTLPGS